MEGDDRNEQIQERNGAHAADLVDWTGVPQQSIESERAPTIFAQGDSHECHV